VELLQVLQEALVLVLGDLVAELDVLGQSGTDDKKEGLKFHVLKYYKLIN